MLCHWDEVAEVPVGAGPMRGTWRDLGRAAGSVRIGVQRARIAPGHQSTPAQMHDAEEELFVVLAGDGTLLLGDEEHPLRAGNAVSRPAGTGVAHAFRVTLVDDWDGEE
jgi:uncharacterized cupin superfamily protein